MFLIVLKNKQGIVQGVYGSAGVPFAEVGHSRPSLEGETLGPEDPDHLRDLIDKLLAGDGETLHRPVVVRGASELDVGPKREHQRYDQESVWFQ